jgi:hypothetical protein
LLLWISTGGRLWRFSERGTAARKTLKGGTNRALALGRTRGLGRTRENLPEAGDGKKATAGLWSKGNLRGKRRDPWHWANALRERRPT